MSRRSMLRAAARRRIATVSYSATVLADTPLHYWRFSETSGATIADIGSAAQSATAQGSYTRNHASLLPAANDPSILLSTTYATAGTAGRFSGNSNFSFECWFRVDSFAASANPVLFFSGRFNNSGWYCQVINTVAANPYIQFTTSSPTSINTESAVGSVVQGSVYHLVCVRNGTSVKIYLNGVEVTYRAVGSHDSITATTDPSEIGAYWNSGPVVNKLNGALDEMAIYNYALSAAQVAAHYAARAA